MAKTRQHARYSPSKLSALSKCVRFEYKELADGSDEEGTMLHKATETKCYTGLTASQSLEVQMAVGYGESLYAGDPGSWAVLKEPKLVLADLTYGHADLVLINMGLKTIHVCDYKFIRTAVDKYAMQLRAYGAAVVSMMLEARTENAMCTIMDDDGAVIWYQDMTGVPVEDFVVYTHVVAPRVTAEPVTETWNAKDLLGTMKRDITLLYAAIDDPFTPPSPDSELCGNCSRIARCPAMNQVVRHAATEIVGLPLPSLFDPANQSISTRDRALGQVLGTILENWAEQVKASNTEFVKAGGEIPGFRLQSRSNGMKIDRTMTMVAIMALRELGYTDEELLGACTLSIAELAKNREETCGKAVGETKEEVKNTLGDIAAETTSTFLMKVKRTPNEAVVKSLMEGA